MVFSFGEVINLVQLIGHDWSYFTYSTKTP